MLEIGTKASPFTLPDQDGNQSSSPDLKGKSVVLFFYPKADSRG